MCQGKRRELLHKAVADHRLQNSGGAFDAEGAAVEHQILVAVFVLVIFTVALVIELTGAIHGTDHFLSGGGIHAKMMDAVVVSGLIGGKYKDGESVLHGVKNAVGASAHNDAGFLCSEILNNIFLDQENFILHAGNAHAERILSFEIDGAGGLLRIADQ